MTGKWLRNTLASWMILIQVIVSLRFWAYNTAMGKNVSRIGALVGVGLILRLGLDYIESVR